MKKITSELKFNSKLIKLVFSHILVFYLEKKIGGKKLLAHSVFKEENFAL